MYIFIASDHLMFSFFRSASVHNPDEKYLEETGYFYIGDWPNVMVNGSLVMNTSCDMTVPIPKPPMIIACNSGAICKSRLFGFYCCF